MTGGGGRTGTRERVPLNLYRLARVAFRVQVTRYNPVAGRVFPSCSGKSITWPAVLAERKESGRYADVYKRYLIRRCFDADRWRRLASSSNDTYLSFEGDVSLIKLED